MVETEIYRRLPRRRYRETGANDSILLSKSSMDWYKLTEATRHVLNKVIVQSGKKMLQEKKLPHPDQEKVEDYRIFNSLAVELLQNPRNFQSKEKMITILKIFTSFEIV